MKKIWIKIKNIRASAVFKKKEKKMKRTLEVIISHYVLLWFNSEPRLFSFSFRPFGYFLVISSGRTYLLEDLEKLSEFQKNGHQKTVEAASSSHHYLIISGIWRGMWGRLKLLPRNPKIYFLLDLFHLSTPFFKPLWTH